MNDTILIVGLGNPGNHKLNRHNSGFIATDYLADTYHYSSGLIRLESAHPTGPLSIILARGIPIQYKIVGNKTVVLLKPQTYMNNSGLAVAAAQFVLQVPHENILLVHDDTAFDFGSFKLKASGGPGGHNGVKSVIEHLGYKDFNRLRIGIGRPKNNQILYDYVLSDFAIKEQSYFCDMCLALTGIFDSFILHSANETMQTFNQRKQ